MTQQHYSRWIATPSSAINGQAPESPYQGLRCSGLNQMEQNAVMYMAGLHLFLKSTSGPQRKWLYRRKTIYLFRSYPRWKHHINLASHQPGDIDSLADYTRTWSNLVDRGGLFHISNEVARLFESIEMVYPTHSRKRNHSWGAAKWVHSWAVGEPLQYEKYSIEFLWTTVRGCQRLDYELCETIL